MAETEEIQHDDIRAALARVTASAGFVKSERIVRLLEYLVDQTLAGQSAGLKGYSIGIDVFDRGEEFDPGQDAIVRVEAGRLRQKLEHYYLTGGKDDPVIIKVPTGTYVPLFHNGRPARPLDMKEDGTARKVAHCDIGNGLFL